MKKIGILGGSFDPIHKGHIEIANIALKELELDEIQLIPTKNNPWKDNVNTSERNRLKMMELAIQEIKNITINTIELESHSDDKNYTIDTIKILKAKHPDVKYYYIMGMDQATLFHQWKNAEEISELVQLVAFQRGGYEDKGVNIEKYHFIVLNNKPIYASSSEVRNGHIEMLDKCVLEYISNKGLYLDTMISLYMKEKRWKHTCSVANLAKMIAKANGFNEQQAYIAGMLHDIAKEMPYEEALELMKKHYPEYLDKSVAIWHQWLSRYVSEYTFLVKDEIILKAIEDHTTGSTSMSDIGKVVYVADKLDPLRGYDSSKQIDICKKDIHEGFRNSLIEFHEFSKNNNRNIDECFYEIYNKYVVKGEK
ncbi:MAG: nicotinate-nucleotide adenylyltransferase [Erysipelotrichales bacterium]|nr:nicotinate-nucleotide adenylyltransferase [Erysipelotrichales bacterium]